MALETGNYVGDLVVTNPAAADPKSQGDDHLRLIKLALRQSFPGFTGAILAAGVSGGAANAYTLTPAEPLLAYIAPMLVVLQPIASNTGATTLNISGLGAVAVTTIDGAALTAGDLVSGIAYVLAYDGTEFRLGAVTKRYVDTLAFSAALPNQAGNAGKFVTTDGAAASWGLVPASALTGLSANAAAVRTGTTTATALTPGDTYNAFAVVALTYAATVTPDFSTFINASIALTGNLTLANPTNPKVGQVGFVELIQDATGSRLLSAVGANWKRSGGVPALTTTANATDILVYQVLSPTFILYDLIRNPS